MRWSILSVLVSCHGLSGLWHGISVVEEMKRVFGVARRRIQVLNFLHTTSFEVFQIFGIFMSILEQEYFVFPLRRVENL